MQFFYWDVLSFDPASYTPSNERLSFYKLGFGDKGIWGMLEIRGVDLTKLFEEELAKSSPLMKLDMLEVKKLKEQYACCPDDDIAYGKTLESCPEEKHTFPDGHVVSLPVNQFLVIACVTKMEEDVKISREKARERKLERKVYVVYFQEMTNTPPSTIGGGFIYFCFFYEPGSGLLGLSPDTRDWLVPSCFVIFDLSPFVIVFRLRLFVRDL
nr:actin-related protein 7 [Tanacetum cinerariifolium]